MIEIAKLVGYFSNVFVFSICHRYQQKYERVHFLRLVIISEQKNVTNKNYKYYDLLYKKYKNLILRTVFKI